MGRQADGRLQGKVALISGAARGQGAAEARMFADEGARVVLGDVLDEVDDVAASIGPDRARAVRLDVTDESSWQQAVTAATEAFGGLHVLVNNAGISPAFRPITETPLDDYLRVVMVNQVGTFLGIKHAAPAMVSAGGGSIVNISSVNGFAGAAGIVGYVSSKFAIRGITRTAALELASSGVRVNSVHPGPIDTPMVQPDATGGFDIRPMMAKAIPQARIAEPDSVARLVLFLASDESDFCTGAEYVVDGGYLAGPLVMRG